jgi:hypothetical protein
MFIFAICPNHLQTIRPGYHFPMWRLTPATNGRRLHWKWSPRLILAANARISRPAARQMTERFHWHLTPAIDRGG